MQTFSLCYTSKLCLKHKQILPTFELEKGISSTWKIIIDYKNLYLDHSEIQ